MFRNIFTKSVYDNRRSILFWGLGVFGLVFMYASIYPSFAGNQQIVTALQNLPDAFKSLIGNLEEYSSPSGFIAGEWFALTYPLLLGILGIVLGSGLITKEEEARTLELLLARPVSRASILRQKAAAMLAVIAALGLASWLAIAVGTVTVEKFHVNLLYAFETCLMGVLIAWSFALLALAVTGLRSARGLAAGVASLWFAAGYIASTVGAKIDWLAPLRKISVFELYKPAGMLRNGWELWHPLLLVGLCLAFYAVAEIGFGNRDSR